MSAPTLSTLPRRALRTVLAASLPFLAIAAHAAETPVFPNYGTQEIDSLVARTQAAFHVPGIAIAVIRDGKVVFAKGYGVRKAGETARIDTMTRFAIGSNTKAFTTAALSILAHDRKLDWSDPLWTHMPEFQLASPELTRQFLVSDLLTHHSGMGEGAGDLMLFWPSNFTRTEIVSRLRYMPFTAPFRLHYAYNNLLYVTAGKLVEDVSHQPWEDFIQSRIMTPAGMKACTPAPLAPKPGEDRASGHGVEGDRAVARPWGPVAAAAPAGSIECSLDGMSTWARLLLNHGKAPNGTQVLAGDQIDEMWSPHALLPLPGSAPLSHTHFRAYGYGWFMEDFYGQKRVWHTGTIQNSVSYVSFLPESHTGIVVLTNQDDFHATYAIMQALSAAAAGHDETDWLAYYVKDAQDSARAVSTRAETTGPGSRARPYITLKPAEASEYAGTYHDAWLGGADIQSTPEGLRLTFTDVGGITGIMKPLPHDLFVAHWDGDEADASYVQFHRDMSGRITNITMHLVESDFSFDVQDLDLRRVSP